MILPVTLTVTAACAIINMWLAAGLVRGRLRGKVMIGDGGNPAVQAGMRAHANFIEYAPIVLILIALIELARGPVTWLWVAGVVFVLARLAHPIGMARAAPNPFRAGGALLTWVVMLALAVWALVIALETPRAVPTTTLVPVVVTPGA